MNWQHKLKEVLLEAIPGDDYATASKRMDLFLALRKQILNATT